MAIGKIVHLTSGEGEEDETVFSAYTVDDEWAIVAVDCDHRHNAGSLRQMAAELRALADFLEGDDFE